MKQLKSFQQECLEAQARAVRVAEHSGTQPQLRGVGPMGGAGVNGIDMLLAAAGAGGHAAGAADAHQQSAPHGRVLIEEITPESDAASGQLPGSNADMPQETASDGDSMESFRSASSNKTTPDAERSGSESSGEPHGPPASPHPTTHTRPAASPRPAPFAFTFDKPKPKRASAPASPGAVQQQCFDPEPSSAPADRERLSSLEGSRLLTDLDDDGGAGKRPAGPLPEPILTQAQWSERMRVVGNDLFKQQRYKASKARVLI